MTWEPDPAPEPVVVEYVLSWKDLVLSLPIWRRMLVVPAIELVFLSLVSPSSAILFAAVFVVLIPFVAWTRGRREARYGMRRSWSITPGVAVVNVGDLVSSTYRPGSLRRVERRKDYIVVRTLSGWVTGVPRSAFHDQRHEQAFLDLAQLLVTAPVRAR